ncbi:homeodomain-only protein-like [Schistocerca americana]|uniref:homeodomain-only protein-like n=1 Tax=Schistocerca americana TaxID=7009 RepID=UPI001F4FEBA2|nr:homeodomain-only protein-like [Schistocerca americana]XP_047113429.1 homeodomain-only protein-like [Schistocerca piceifrons]XP_049810430.1 homeodomain-only protein-like [Schistocerca nitens]XP_049860211.1 homeodomain-only protein-like [Schistocerca gregaria]XP_049860212.1 homeodomain-only protein-like [Schistocerca gregaria]XP_049957140.1 homeodomain-only protein-like [Schistocerca serialis cubense]
MLRSVSPQLSPGSNSSTPPPSLTPDQASVLEAQFQRLKNPHPTDLILLAAETGLDERQVQAWFNMRLAAWRKEQGLPASFGHFNSY